VQQQPIEKAEKYSCQARANAKALPKIENIQTDREKMQKHV